MATKKKPAAKKPSKRSRKAAPPPPASFVPGLPPGFRMATPEMLRELLGGGRRKPEKLDAGPPVVIPTVALMYLLEQACEPPAAQVVQQQQPDIRKDIGEMLDRLRAPALEEAAPLHNEAAMAYHALGALMTAMNVVDNPQSHELTRTYFAAISSTNLALTSIKDKVAAHAKECATCKQLACAMHVIPLDQSTAN